MLRYQILKTLCISRIFENDLLLVFPCSYVIWYNFWGNFSHSSNVFKLQKRVIRIITNSGNRDSCRDLFRKLEILPFYSQYIFSLLKFVIDNASLFKTNSEIYDLNTRNKNNFHLSLPRLAIYKNGVYYMGIKAFNHLPPYIKELSEDRLQFKNVLKIIFY